MLLGTFGYKFLCGHVSSFLANLALLQCEFHHCSWLSPCTNQTPGGFPDSSTSAFFTPDSFSLTTSFPLVVDITFDALLSALQGQGSLCVLFTSVSSDPRTAVHIRCSINVDLMNVSTWRLWGCYCSITQLTLAATLVFPYIGV